jgi:hypothetical protein
MQTPLQPIQQQQGGGQSNGAQQTPIQGQQQPAFNIPNLTREQVQSMVQVHNFVEMMLTR